MRFRRSSPPNDAMLYQAIGRVRMIGSLLQLLMHEFATKSMEECLHGREIVMRVSLCSSGTDSPT